MDSGAGTAGDDRLRSAVFVDFDNVFSGLRDLDPAAADRFASDPAPWLAWIQGGMPGREEPRLSDLGERRLLIRRCYLNPVVYARYRPFFIRTGFSVIDCPPLTKQGKTSTDIHMVMDVLDTLRDYEHITEYILLSGDADFTPVLNRLRARDKRTAVLSVGPAAAAYRAAADRVLAENDFVEVGLELGAPPEPVAPVTAASDQWAELREAMIATVRKRVATSPGALPLARVAHELRAKFDPRIDETDWAGTGSFTGLLRSADLGLEVTASPGYILDPARHERPPVAVRESADALPSRVADVVTKVANVTGTPLLTAAQHAAVFQALASHLETHSYAISETAKAVRDRCNAAGQKISRQSVNAILRGIAYRHGFEEGHPKTAKALARVHADNVLGLADAAQLALTDEERVLATAWLTGKG